MGDGPAQTIYVPTSNGVEAQTVYTGPDRTGAALDDAGRAELRDALRKIALYGNPCAEWVAEQAVDLKGGYLDGAVGPRRRRDIPADWRASNESEIELQCIMASGAGKVTGDSQAERDANGLLDALVSVIGDPVASNTAKAQLDFVRSRAIRAPLNGAGINYLDQIAVELFAPQRLFSNAHGDIACGQSNCRFLHRVCGSLSRRYLRDLEDIDGLKAICRFRNADALLRMRDGVL
ncbi:hypothetical protein [Alteriqipengyuania sp. 357]